MSRQTKLLLIACSGEETTQLTRDIYAALRQNYGLEEQVEFLISQRRAEIDKDMPKAHRHPLVADYFPDGEVQVDIGGNELKDVIRGKHVVLVEHLLTPARLMFQNEAQCVSVNDHHQTVRGFLEVIASIDTLQRTLAVPYLTYVRSHSVERYQRKGFYQFDSLRTLLLDYQKGGLNAIATIDPHSMKAAQLAEELGMELHVANPFQSGRAINPYKLGLTPEKAREVLKHLRPFQERFVGLKEHNAGHLYAVSVDAGTERRVENFVERSFPNLAPEEVYALIAHFDKERIGYQQTSTSFKPFSQINGQTIDTEGIYIILDDMFASGGTADAVAMILKELGVKRVEVWTSHAVTMPSQHARANDRQYIDAVVCLDTIPQHPNLNIEYIRASADLLAAELYKAHQKLVALR